MSTSFRPQEAKEDNYVLGVVAALLIGGAMFVLASMINPAGPKVVVLGLTGLEMEATVQSVRPVEDFSGRDVIALELATILDFDNTIDEVSVIFTDHNGREIVTSFLVQAHQHALQVDDPFAILYSRFSSDISLPSQSMSAYRVDAWIFSSAAGVMVLCLLSVVIIVLRWRAFRSRARRY